MLAPLRGGAAGCAQGAAVTVVCALWSWPAGAAANCCFRLLLKWWLWSWPAGATAGFGAGLQGADSGCW